MAPTIIKQKKLFLKGEQDNEVNFSRLEATAIAEIPITVIKSHYCIFIWLSYVSI